MTDHSEARVEAAKRAASEWESFIAGDGVNSIRMREGRTPERIAVDVLAAAEEADRTAGVIHVDTRDEALIDRLARVLCEVDQAHIPTERRETMEQTGSGDDFRDMIRAVLAALAGAQPPPEGETRQ